MNARSRTATVIAVGFFILWLSAGSAAAATDEEILSQGEAAIENGKQCTEAYRRLKAMPAALQADSRWLPYMAKAAECLKQYDEALAFYRRCLASTPDVVKFKRKIVEMNCRLDWEARERYGDLPKDESGSHGKMGADACVETAEIARLSRTSPETKPAPIGNTVGHTEVAKTNSDLKRGSRIVAFIEGSDNIQALGEIGRIWDQRLGLQVNCNSARKVKLESFAIIKQITLPELQNVPTEGMWSYRFNYERCGEGKTYNAILEIKPN
jgi:hypothetical protein